ncbi:CDP-diacylglycerol--glycerol-3-phosphate 3-phosphatidyltransferase [Pseudobythopirellula maris]|uniref:CDP-diacylglycerol--glycerol-3-phosphate 3-phosphatidyltransferase n=1 Tax=Pseudobythopirellula maris TaxID=2527991 RepID=A0A5C5ZTN7_9BACT|nr:CDP-diacylglycerol--glycerol-3-phosphate 3-phosphatidyltransferase [Pseudobythopirellula maris]TWT90427.1 CDP-diacylglycerol--glycerol-3-phosphate 3-phosphatidyltransferase [Pseudobythopirellula maris]
MNGTPDNVPLGSLRNVPNQLTIARLVLSGVCFAAIHVGWYFTALVLFVVAAGTDWLDGYWARRFNQITKIGRVLDPFADKIIICGVFIMLAAQPGSHVPAWVAVVVTAREMLVTALRSFIEAAGGDFSAQWVGKWKMVFQCAAAGFSLLTLWLAAAGRPAESLRPFGLTTDVLVWIALALTIYSGWGYVAAALRMTRSAATDNEAP